MGVDLSGECRRWNLLTRNLRPIAAHPMPGL